MKTFPTPEALRRFPFGLADIAVILGTLVLLTLVARVGAGALVSFEPPDIVPAIDLDPRNLPYYAGRSTLRMFIALFFSTVFTLVYGYVAALKGGCHPLSLNLIEADADNRVTDLHVWYLAPDRLAATIALATHYPQPPEHYKQLLTALNLSHVVVEVNPCHGEPCLTASSFSAAAQP